jgi:hypothetical protein
MELLDISKNQELQHSVPELIIRLETAGEYRRILPYVITYNRQAGLERTLYRAIELEDVLAQVEEHDNDTVIGIRNDEVSEKYPLVAVTSDEANRAAVALARSHDFEKRALGMNLNQCVAYIERRKLLQRSPSWLEAEHNRTERKLPGTRPATPGEAQKLGSLVLAS